jgi:D-glycero-D-manno-heptose 1,7-bisphosphate phosphatase
MNKALFLDRDGVINHDPGDYTTSLEEFVVLPTVIPALKLAHQKGYLIIIVTNQAGIAKGLYNHEEVHKMHDKLQQACRKEGFEITHFYYSPHHPDYSQSLTRKPGSLLLERAIGRYKIDPTRSIMIGDKERDVQCAHAVGVKGLQIPTNDDLITYVSTLIEI